MSDPTPTYGARPHATWKGCWVADDLFNTDSFGQATVMAKTLEEAIEKFDAHTFGGSFALRPEAPR